MLWQLHLYFLNEEWGEKMLGYVLFTALGRKSPSVIQFSLDFWHLDA